MPKTQGTRDGYKASVRVGESPSETLECHADAFVYILRPKGSYSKGFKKVGNCNVEEQMQGNQLEGHCNNPDARCYL